MIFQTTLAQAATQEGNPLVQITEQFGINLPSLLAQILNFCLLAFVLYRFAIKPILATLDERQSKISSGLAYAEQMQQKLKETEAQVAEMIKKASMDAQAIILEAQNVAKANTQAQLQETTRQVEDMLHKAQSAAFQERKQLLESAKQEIVQMVIATTKAVLSQELNNEERERFSARAIRELAS
jgi:F-type H+-transporting ATPase subunit b